jgi:hypothetical protein
MSFICPVCQAQFTTKGNMIKHIKKYHPEYDVNNIQRKSRGSTQPIVSVAPIVATEPMISVPIVNNEIEILRLKAQHQANLEIQALRLELGFVKSQNEMLKSLLDKALSRPFEVFSLREHIVGPIVSKPAVPEPAVSELVVSEPEPVVSEPEPVFSEKKVSNNKQNVNNKLNGERPYAVPYAEFINEFALGEYPDHTNHIFTHKNNMIEPHKNIYKFSNLYTDIKGLTHWLNTILKLYFSPEMEVSPFEIIDKKVYVKNESNVWVDGNEKLMEFVKWILFKLSDAVNNLNMRVNTISELKASKMTGREVDTFYQITRTENLIIDAINELIFDTPKLNKFVKSVIKTFIGV